VRAGRRAVLAGDCRPARQGQVHCRPAGAGAAEGTQPTESATSGRLRLGWLRLGRLP
jgi:hypothetical protein